MIKIPRRDLKSTMYWMVNPAQDFTVVKIYAHDDVILKALDFSCRRNHEK